MGAKTSRMAELKQRLGRFKKTRNNISTQLACWYQICKKQGMWQKMPRENKEIIRMVLRAKKKLSYRMRMVTSRDIYRQRKTDDRIFRVIFLTGSF